VQLHGEQNRHKQQQNAGTTGIDRLGGKWPEQEQCSFIEQRDHV
jgi:hypothetical protein